MKVGLIPPKSVILAAKTGLELRKKFGRGGTVIGEGVAKMITSGESLSPQLIVRIVSYFARHEVDKRGKDFFNKEKPSNGYIAWQLWGGDAGWEWAKTVKKELV